jgi:hypothetical protein
MAVPPLPPIPLSGPQTPREARLAAGLGPEHTGPETMLCTCCGHSARSHPDSTSCSHRGRWWRRCMCSGYTGFDSVDRP